MDASWAEVGSATFINLYDVPKSTSAAAAPNPLKGIFVLSNLASVTFASAIIVVTTLSVPIAVTPAFVMVRSPVTATAAATLDPLPIKISPSFNDDPIGETPVIVVELALVILPFASTTIVGTVVAVP